MTSDDPDLSGPRVSLALVAREKLLRLRVSETELEAWRLASRAAGLPVSSWLRHIATLEAGRVAAPPPAAPVKRRPAKR